MEAGSLLRVEVLVRLRLVPCSAGHFPADWALITMQRGEGLAASGVPGCP